MITVPHQFDHCYLSGAVAPPTGASCFLELPSLNSATFELWGDGLHAAVPHSWNLVVLDNGACHNAQALQWPANVVPLFLPPSSPALHPLARLWRDRKDQLAAHGCHTLEAWSEAVCTVIPGYAEAALKSLTGVDYFGQAVEAARRAYV